MSSVVSIETGRRPRGGNSGEYLLIELARPGEPPRSIGVLLRDMATGRVYSKVREHWDEIADPEEAELLEALNRDFRAKIDEMGGDAFLLSLEDSLSNTLQLSRREALIVDDFARTLDRLYEEHVEAA